jgi:N-acetylglucosaminyl-diphospho-decaprenol L-rhamnosyltransferase
MASPNAIAGRSSVSAVLLAMRRSPVLDHVLDRLAELPVDEVLVVHNAPPDRSFLADRSDPRLRVVPAGDNVGVAGRNLGAQAATGDYLLMLDDDSYPLPGAVEVLSDALSRDPRLAAVGGLVRTVDQDGRVVRHDEVGGFDWLLRAGRNGVGPEGLPAFWFPEGGVMLRRSAYLQVGGFFEPFFFTWSEIDLATRLLQAGWDVRYLPGASFDHVKPQPEGPVSSWVLQHRVRNQLWYFWLRFPASVAARRMPAYLLFDLIECTYRRVPGAWARGIAEAWRERDRVRAFRDPMPRALLPRAEMNRGRMHLRLLGDQLRRRLPGGRRRQG